MKKKKLPIGIQTFSTIRDPKENYVYVDKTDIAFNLIDNGSYYFLSRPRRFGKSLFLDTLSEIFKGSKQLFEGLAIYDKWDWNQSYPVINISFAVGEFFSRETIKDRISTILEHNCINLLIDNDKCKNSQLGTYFENMIRDAFQKPNQKVVILIDEYDKPILDNIHKEDKQPSTDAREILRNFYSAIKASDAYIKFVFLTGVSKFSKLNLFSGLNNLNDITIDTDYSTITGYTHDDIINEFSEYTHNVDLEEVRCWYNGYNYFGEPIYNPFDILLFFSKNAVFSNYWWETGNPSFLIEILKKSNYNLPELENIIVSKETLSAFDIEHIDVVALLWQTGYLTFDKEINIFGRITYKMKIPNREIQISLNALFLDYLTNINGQKAQIQNNVAISLLELKFDVFKQNIHSLFASISYTGYVNNNIGIYEGYYVSVVFAFLSSIGLDIVLEDHTNKGRIDMTIKTPDTIFILEFKVDVPEETAIQQIKTKKYYEKYLFENKTIYLLGMHFSSTEKNIVGFDWEIFK
ncbi:MAG: ATP-binding protein [Bacteroidales bacterium]|nr:ATP-binding protein [Bacteroidales bacterium]